MNARLMRQVAALLAGLWAALLILSLVLPLGLARAADAPAAVDAPAAQMPETPHPNPDVSQGGSQGSQDGPQGPSEDDWGANEDEQPRSRSRHHHIVRSDSKGDDDVFALGRDALLPRGENAGSVVSIGGEARSEGSAHDVLSILGSTRVLGSVDSDAVAVIGDTYIDGTIGGDVMALVGNLELGPHANIGGDAVSVLGTLKRAPGSVVRGEVQAIGASGAGFTWLKPWISHCLLFGRPLAFDARVEWAWGVALVFLSIYVLLTLLFPRGIETCVATFEAEPGKTILASFLMVLLIPLVFALLAITLIGFAAMPCLFAALNCAVLFGKAALLTWIGKRLLSGRGPQWTDGGVRPVAATLLGGSLVLVAYVVPVVGFLVFNVLGLLSLGVVAVTIFDLLRARRARPAMQPGTSQAASASASVGASPAGASPAGASPSEAGASPSSRSSGASSAGGASSASGLPQGRFSARVDPALAASLPRAGFWIRMSALCIDAILVGFVMSVLRHESELYLLVLAVYGALMWKLRGSTLGGIIFDLQVARVDGRPVDWETSIIRALGCFLSLFVAGLGFFWIAFDPGRQAWHDKIAGTVVVRVPKPVAAPA